MASPQAMPELRALQETGPADAAAIVVCGGDGIRFGRMGGKTLAPLCGLPLAAWAVVAAASAPSIARVVVVCRFGDEAELVDAFSGLPMVGELLFARAGRTRQESVRAGLACIGAQTELVSIHDGARPLARPALFESTLSALRHDAALSGAIAAYPATDTLKLCERGIVLDTPDRSLFWCAQTPQSFRAEHLLRAFEAADREGWQVTDDASLVERWGGRVLCVEAPHENLKVTYPEDLAMAEALLSERLSGEWGAGL